MEKGLQQSLKPSGKREFLLPFKNATAVILRKLLSFSVHTLGDDNVLGIDRDTQCFTH